MWNDASNHFSVSTMPSHNRDHALKPTARLSSSPLPVSHLLSSRPQPQVLERPMVGIVGLEPTHPQGHQILSLTRLPVPSYPLIVRILIRVPRTLIQKTHFRGLQPHTAASLAVLGFQQRTQLNTLMYIKRPRQGCSLSRTRVIRRVLARPTPSFLLSGSDLSPNPWRNQRY